MISTEYGSISSIVAYVEEEENAMQLVVTIMLLINAVLLVTLMPLMMAMHHTLVNLNKLIRGSDTTCKSELCMNRRTFNILCEMVRDIGGLIGSRYMPLEDIVAMFLYTFAHPFKNTTVGSYFYQSGASARWNKVKTLKVLTKEEKWTLVHGLLELSVNPQWKGEGSFKGGYLVMSEEKMNTKCPRSGLKAYPHIDSKIKWFREKYNNHKQTKGLWGVPFQFLDELGKLFGADRVTGTSCEDYVEVVDNLHNDNNSHLETIASAFTTTQQHKQVIMACELHLDQNKGSLMKKRKGLFNEVMKNSRAH
ncbi:hypothetical protein Cgig2_011727 [Carnegiea gigantea]|uniref:DUF8040 domain-containing protein n=1 Tax=Carnegiea gigantea TaxID=171969 RepID=A0A9Q1QLT3_9CARY|nr:hypothetical protein Cgig2_011727 [Carnegiea gigantea]